MTVEFVCVLIFTVEYVIRLLTVHAVNMFVITDPSHPSALLQPPLTVALGLRRTWDFCVSPFNVIDFLAIVPFYIEYALTSSSGLGVLRILRVLRLARSFPFFLLVFLGFPLFFPFLYFCPFLLFLLFPFTCFAFLPLVPFRALRVFKLSKFSTTVEIFYHTLHKSASELVLLLFISAIIVSFFSSLIYFCELGTWSPQDQEYRRQNIYNDGPQEPSPFRSITDSFWWTTTTITTVGYGDFYPTTAAGKIVASITALVGVVFISLPITIIGARLLVEEQLSSKNMKAFGTTLDQLKVDMAGCERGDDLSTAELVLHDLSHLVQTYAEDVRGNVAEAQDMLVIVQPERLLTWFPTEDRTWRKRIFRFFDDPESCRLAGPVSIGILVLIAISTASFVISTVPRWNRDPGGDCGNCEPTPLPVFNHIETVSIAIFTVEYLCRVLTVHVTAPGPPPPRDVEQRTEGWPSSRKDINAIDAEDAAPAIAGRSSAPAAVGHASVLNNLKSGLVHTLKFMVVPLNLIDLMAILPFYLALDPNMQDNNFSFIRILRLARIFRIFKVGKYSGSIVVLFRTLSKSIVALQILVLFTVIGMLLFGSLIHFAEGGSYDATTALFLRDTKYNDGSKEVSPYRSIPSSFWWVIATSSTVGYGDYYPTSPLGKLIASVLMLLGIVSLALPISILGENFQGEWDTFSLRKSLRQFANEVESLGSAAKQDIRDLRLIDITDEASFSEVVQVIQPAINLLEKIEDLDLAFTEFVENENFSVVDNEFMTVSAGKGRNDSPSDQKVTPLAPAVFTPVLEAAMKVFAFQKSEGDAEVGDVGIEMAIQHASNLASNGRDLGAAEAVVQQYCNEVVL
jgi:hypothetical protein